MSRPATLFFRLLTGALLFSCHTTSGPSAPRAADTPTRSSAEGSTERDGVLSLLDRELKLSLRQETSVQELLKMDADRKRNRTAREDSQALLTPDEPASLGEPPPTETDMAPLLEPLEDITLEQILRQLDSLQTPRYLQLLGNDGLARIRGLTDRRSGSQDWIELTPVRFDPAETATTSDPSSFLAEVDRNDNGKVDPHEAPKALRNLFSRFDLDGDGALDSSELLQARETVARLRGKRPR